MTAPLRRQHLATVAAALRGSAPLDADDAKLIADAFDQIAQGEDADKALGLRSQRADMLAAIGARNRILRDAAEAMPSDLPIIEAALRLHKELRRYREGGWRRERQFGECPLRHRGTLREVAWRALRLWDHVPAQRTIRRILAEDGKVRGLRQPGKFCEQLAGGLSTMANCPYLRRGR